MFLKSKEWCDFQKDSGLEIVSLDDKQPYYAVKHDLMFSKNYLYSPYFESCRELIEKGKTNNSIFVKCEPMTEDKKISEFLKNNGFVKSHKSIQPQKTTIVDLLDDDSMLAQMKKKTRYSIRRGIDKKVVVLEKKDINVFWELIQETTKRSDFRAHKKEYYENLLKMRDVYMFVSFVNNKETACAIIIKDKDRIVYLHGASTRLYKEYMSPFALQWYIMRYFYKKGCREYDMWGIDEVKWRNVTRFKKGFGGRQVDYIGSYDFVINPLFYNLYKIKQKINR